MHSWSFRGNSMPDRLGRLHLALTAIRSPRLGRTIREQESGNWFCRVRMSKLDSRSHSVPSPNG
jgi:hypothetical protein